MQVRDVMTHGVIGVTEDTSVAEAIETMLRSRVSALFVLDAKNELIGILSEGDLLRRSEIGSEHKRPRWLEFLLGSGRLAETYAHEHGRKVGEVMTPDVETIEEGAELSEAVDRMIRRRIKRLPVLRGETVVGVISRSDLLKGLLAGTPRAKGPHPTPRSRPPSRRSSTSSTGRRARACASRSRAASSLSTARSPTNGFATASRSSPRIRLAASPSTTTWPGSSRTRDTLWRRRRTKSESSEIVRQFRRAGRPDRSPRSLMSGCLARVASREFNAGRGWY